MQVFEVTAQDMMAAEGQPDKQLALAILKSKGAPIVGDFLLEVDKTYDVCVSGDLMGNLTYTFRKRGADDMAGKHLR